MRLQRPNAKASRRGAAIVETAFILPLLGLVLFAVWEIGRMIHIQQMVWNAAREAARAGSTGLAPSSDNHPEQPARLNYEVQEVARAYLRNANIPLDLGSATEVTVINQSRGLSRGYPSGSGGGADPITSAAQFDRLTVRVEYNFEPVRWSPMRTFIPAGTIVRAEVEWQNLRDLPIVVDDSIPGTPLP